MCAKKQDMPLNVVSKSLPATKRRLTRYSLADDPFVNPAITASPDIKRKRSKWLIILSTIIILAVVFIIIYIINIVTATG